MLKLGLIQGVLIQGVQYIEEPNKVDSVQFRKQLLELKNLLGQARMDVLTVNKSKTKKTEGKIEVEIEKVETPEVTPEVATLNPTTPEPQQPEVSTPEVSTPEPQQPEPQQPEVQPIAVVDT